MKKSIKIGFAISVSSIVFFLLGNVAQAQEVTEGDVQEILLDRAIGDYADSLNNESDSTVLILQQNVGTEEYDRHFAELYRQGVIDGFALYFKELSEADSTDSILSEVPDSVYRSRLALLLSPIKMSYNPTVKRFLVIYSEQRKELMANILSLSHQYFPMIERELEAAGLPLELRMLPVIESALNPNAVSRAGATGLWQFMYATGKHYGLEVTSYLDQRRAPEAATKAACKYLKHLHDIYNDWSLAISAYNCGPGNVNKAIKRAGAERGSADFWTIYNYLPRETRGYFPAFIAANYTYAFHQKHGIEASEREVPIAVDTIMVTQLMHFKQVCETLDIPIETLRTLNPEYKLDIVPAVTKPYPITLPQAYASKYLEHEQEIKAKDSIHLASYLARDKQSVIAEVTAASIRYRVVSGDTLGGIAAKHNVKVSQIIKWNNITNPNSLKIGQRLEIFSFR